ncbi:MAG TPA: DUF5666 domain-containing protein [Casimicrobiaceae bacterium]|nr:DUF5666 domain-containing protein [Casimicrobiaceae bacterium]
MNRIVPCLAAFLCAGVASSAALAKTTTTRVIRGDVAALEPSVLRVKSPTGQESIVRVPDDMRVSVRAPATLDAIKAGSYVGVTASRQPDGTLLASEVHIFPESMRGTAEGHRPMAALPGSTMTNATVARVSPAKSATRSTMTNTAVAKVGAAGNGRTLQLAYAGGEQTIVVPDGVPVVTTESGNRSSLSAGEHVIVTAQRGADGQLAASRISVGKNGSVPPI